MKRTRILFLSGISLLAVQLAGCEQKSEERSLTVPSGSQTTAGAAVAAPEPKQESRASNVVTTNSGLKYEVIQEGTGPGAAAGQSVSVHYTGWLENGTKFDSSLDRGQPFGFHLGAGQVIKGWDEGVAGMKAGEKRKLTIPSNLGYGSRGAGGVIPPNATLIFEVQLLSFK